MLWTVVTLHKNLITDKNIKQKSMHELSIQSECKGLHCEFNYFNASPELIKGM